ncbi:MAG: thiamine phosphate synthase [Spirochaetales bacterium]|nr:thiamine phosphate synthase [Spirochaetales bacterium]
MTGVKISPPAGLLRILDASGNRLCEGLRVLEDQCRFSLSLDREGTALKDLRHQCRRTLQPLQGLLLRGRDTEGDGGWEESRSACREVRRSSVDLMTANFKRSQEACRTLFETGLTLQQRSDQDQPGPEALGGIDFRVFESMRREIYRLEKGVLSRLLSSPRTNPLPAPLYCLTHREVSRDRGNVETARMMLEGGAKILQYREKDLEGAERYREAREIRKMTRDYGCLFYVNDYVELALMVEADGVHVGQDDYDPLLLREFLGESMVIGLSTHSPEQLERAHELPVDYLGVGPIFATKTKKNVCAPVGFEYLEHAVAHSSLPFVAIGGIKKHNIHEVLNRGARCTALVTEITGSADPCGEVQIITDLIVKGEKK